ncbi:MAG TPA: DUF2007 domain-containing protein [Terracidiphilus sp.]
MSNDALRELAADFADLTDTAKQALRGEMRTRGLADREQASGAPKSFSVESNAPMDRLSDYAPPVTDATLGRAAVAFGSRQPVLVPDPPNSSDEETGPHDYTWKTVLCECDTDEEATQLSEALQQAGIDCWIDGGRTPSAYLGYATEGLVANLRILVAADQLDQARAIAARPIPTDIVAESKDKVPDFVAPSCPSCGAADPVLETVDPVNSWKCEQCGREWTDPLPAESGNGCLAPVSPA